MKKIISYLITAMMVFTIIPSIAFAGTASEQQISANENVLEMKYDDHINLIGKDVEIIDAGNPKSYQVGYGIPDGTKDIAVVTLKEKKLVATGIGSAKVSIEGKIYDVKVTAASLSVLLLIGQSNMEGIEGNRGQSISCKSGQVYATYGDHRSMNISNASNYAASALTGEKSNINVNGTTEGLREYPIYELTNAGMGKHGVDSGIAYQWIKDSGEKVWIINAAHSGSGIDTWQKEGYNYLEAKALFNACMNTLRNEVAAGHFTLSHMGYYWCQGCSDGSQSAEWYVGKYLAMHKNLKKELAYDEKNTFEFGGIIPIYAGSKGYRTGVYTESSPLPFFQNFRALEMVGPRVAQFWMANNPELEDIYITCIIADNWVEKPDGTNGVAKYFSEHYKAGRVDYPTQVVQARAWRTPQTPADVKDNIHYNQIGYNEVGIECARNTMYILGYKEKKETPKVTYYDWTGYKTVDSIDAVVQAGSGSLVVPVVEPCYMSKDVTYNTSKLLTYNYYDLIGGACHGGSVTASTGETVKVNATAAHDFSGEYAVDIPATMDSDGCKIKYCTICEAAGNDTVVIPRIKKATVANLVYNGSVRTPTPYIVNNFEDTKLENGVDYTVVYKDANAKIIVKPKNVGKYTAAITFQGDYEGTIERAFTINPKATTLNKVTSPAKKQLKVTWQKRTEQVTGYQIRYSIAKDFKTYGQKKVKGYKNVTTSFKNLKAKKTYYVKIRTYKAVGDKTYYSAWSKVKTVKTK